MYDNYPEHMWLAGDGEGVVLVCEGPCKDTEAGDLAVAEYGNTNRRGGVTHFELADLTAFLAFVERHARSCKNEWAKGEPNWGPLEALIPQDQWGQWMWMGRVEHDSVTIEQYKHHDTRGYINISADGRMWRVVHQANDYCPPFCKSFDPPTDPQHVCVPEVVTVDIRPITQDAAFRGANVWPWSLHDEAHPAPDWMRS